jgi:GT2 family glycosyltransferase
MAPPSLPRASVIICTRNRPRLLRETIASILEGSLLPEEVVVVDQSATPDAGVTDLDAGRLTEIRYVPAEPAGLGRARNVGVAAAQHDVLVFADDDMRAERAWLEELLSVLVASGPRAVVTGSVPAGVPERPGGYTPSARAGTQPEVFRGRIWRDVLAGGNMALYRVDLAAVGGFDDRLGAGARFPAADDNDLGFRLLERGYDIVYVPGAVLEHRAWRPRWSYPVVRWRYGRGKGGFYAKHLHASERYMLRRAGRDIGHRLARLPGTLVRQPVRALGDLTYIAGIVAGGIRWLLSERDH